MMDGCIEFDGYRNKDGYGRVSRGGRVVGAHRSAWMDAHGSIPAGLHVLHRCDNPPCINPEHLFLGTPADNARDRDAKGRGSCGRLVGTTNPNAKLTPEVVQAIRRRCAAGELQRVIADDYGVHKGLVSQIHTGKIWKGV